MKSKLMKKITAIALTAAMSLSVFGAFGSAVFAEDEQVDYFKYGAEEEWEFTKKTQIVFTDVNQVEVEWNMSVASFIQTDNYYWDPDVLKWQIKSEIPYIEHDTTEANLSGDKDKVNTYKITNNGSKNINATTTFENLIGDGWNPSLTYSWVEKNCSWNEDGTLSVSENNYSTSGETALVKSITSIPNLKLLPNEDNSDQTERSALKDYATTECTVTVGGLDEGEEIFRNALSKKSEGTLGKFKISFAVAE